MKGKKAFLDVILVVFFSFKTIMGSSLSSEVTESVVSGTTINGELSSIQNNNRHNYLQPIIPPNINVRSET